MANWARIVLSLVIAALIDYAIRTGPLAATPLGSFLSKEVPGVFWAVLIYWLTPGHVRCHWPWQRRDAREPH